MTMCLKFGGVLQKKVLFDLLNVHLNAVPLRNVLGDKRAIVRYIMLCTLTNSDSVTS